MDRPSGDLTDVVEAWLQAYEGYKNYLQASENLYTAFDLNWHGSRPALVEAFDTFRESLVSVHGYRHLEASTTGSKHGSRIG